MSDNTSHTQICPSLKELRDFGCGRLAREDLDRIAAHVEECKRCESFVKQSVVQSGEFELSGPSGSESTAKHSAGRDLAGHVSQNADGASDANSWSQDIYVVDRASSTAALPPGRLASSMSDVVPVFSPGTRRIGSYRIDGLLGRGGMGVVYEATDERLNRSVALKVLPTAAQMDPVYLHRFMNESKAAAQLRHDNIVPVYEVGESDGISYYTMQLIRGSNLGSIVKDIRSSLHPQDAEQLKSTQQNVAETAELPDRGFRTAPAAVDLKGSGSTQSGFSVSEFSLTRSNVLGCTRGLSRSVARLGATIAEALHHVHQLGIIHRDVKPSNLMLDDAGKPWITDFGLAKSESVPGMTQTGMLLGTLRYMSPEQASGRRAFVDHRTDIYSLGVTLYELLTLRRAFDGNNTADVLRQVTFGRPLSIRKINPSVPRDLETIVEKAMSRSPEDRYISAAEMAEDLRRFCHGEPVLARRPTLARRVVHWRKRHPRTMMFFSAFFTGLLMTSVSAAGWYYHALGAAQQEKERVARQLDKSEGLRLAANSALEVNENPRLALELARRGSELYSGLEVNQALITASDANHEYATVIPRESSSGPVSISADGRFAVTSANGRFWNRGPCPAIIHDMKDGRSVATLESSSCVTSAAFDPRSRFVATTSSPTRASDLQNGNPFAPPVIWDALSGEKVHTFSEGRLPVAHDRMFDEGGNRIVFPQGDEAAIISLDDMQTELICRGHTAAVLYAEFNAAGDRLLTVSDDRSIGIWDATSGNRLSSISHTAESALNVTARFSGDSSTVIIADATGTRLYALADAPEIPIAIRPEKNVAVARRSALAALYSRGSREVRLVDARTFRPISTLHVSQGVRFVRVLGDSDGVMVVSGDIVEIFAGLSGKRTSSLRGHEGAVNDAQATPDGSRIVSVGVDRTVRFWSRRSGSEQRKLNEPGEKFYVPHLAFSADGRQFAVASSRHVQTQAFSFEGEPLRGPLPGEISATVYDSTSPVTIEGDLVRVWDAGVSRVTSQIRLPGREIRFAQPVGPDGKLLLLTWKDPAMLWDPSSGGISFLTDPDTVVRSYHVNRTNENFALGMTNGEVLIFSRTTMQQVHRFDHPSPIRRVKLAAEGDRLVTLDEEGRVRLWNRGFEESSHELKPTGGAVDYVSFANNGSHVVTWGQDLESEVKLWDADSGDLASNVGATRVSGPDSVAVHPNKPLIAMRSIDEPTELFDFEASDSRLLEDSGADIFGFTQDAIFTASSATQPLFNYLTIVSEPKRRESELCVWGLDDGRLRFRRKLSVSPYSLKSDPDRNELAIVGRAYQADIFEAESSGHTSSVAVHASPIVFLEFMDDGRRIITASLDGRIQANSSDGSNATFDTQHDNLVTCGALSSDGKLLAVGDIEGRVAVWDLGSGEQVKLLTSHAGSVRGLAFGRSGISLLSWGADSTVDLIDLRTDTSQEFDIPGGVASVEFVDDERHFIAVTGTVIEKIVPDERSWSRSIHNEADMPAAVVVDLQSGAQHRLDLRRQVVGVIPNPVRPEFLLITERGGIELFHVGQMEGLHVDVGDARVIRGRFSPDGKHLLLYHRSGLSIWDWIERRQLSEVPVTGPPAVNFFDPQECILFGSGGRFAVVSMSTGDVERVPIDITEGPASLSPRAFTDRERRRFHLELTEQNQ